MHKTLSKILRNLNNNCYYTLNNILHLLIQYFLKLIYNIKINLCLSKIMMKIWEPILRNLYNNFLRSFKSNNLCLVHRCILLNNYPMLIHQWSQIRNHLKIFIRLLLLLLFWVVRHLKLSKIIAIWSIILNYYLVSLKLHSYMMLIHHLWHFSKNILMPLIWLWT